MRSSRLSEDDETLITEITFLPDGRLCIFGASQQVLALLGELDLGDADLQKRCAHLQALNLPPSGARMRTAIGRPGFGDQA